MSTFKKLSSITLAMLLIIMTFVFTAPVSSLAAEGDFSYEVTAVSGPVSGSINQSQIINVMYGIPLVLKITANRPFNLDYGIYGVGKVTCSIDDISPTEKQFTVKAKNISDYNYDSNPIYLYFKDENDDTITTFNFDAKAEPYHITGITLNKTRLTLAVGQTFQLTASLTPSTHPDDISVSTHWYTGNGDVVTVSDNGLVTAVGIGGTYIGADPYPTSTYELIFGQCNVEVVNKIPAESLEVALVDGSDGYLSGDLLTLEKGKTAHLKTTVTPSNSTDYIAFDNLNDGIIDIEGTPYITALNKGNSSTTVTVGNKSVTLRVRVLEKVPAVAATCTEAGNSVYWTDINGNKYSDKNGTSVTDPTIAALGHNFGDWEITKHPTETEEGEGKHTCTRCGFEETEIIPAKGADSYAFTADSVFTWEKGSKTGMPVTVKNTSGDDAATFGKFANVYVDGKKLTRNTDYTAEEGSIKVTLSAEYLQSLDTGTHIIKIELTVTSLEHEFTVTEPGSAPLTGDSIWTIVLFSALAVVSAAALIFVLVLRKKNHVK